MNDMTQFIAMVAAPYLIVTGAGFLVSAAFYEKMITESGKSDRMLINLSGAVHFLVGVLILVQHFNWGSFREGTVTLLGVAAVTKGASLIVIPELTLKSPKMSQTTLRFSAFAFLLVGGYLSYIGYIH